MNFLDRIFGRHLANFEEHEQKVGPLAGIPMLGLDALSSSAYGPEAALTVLLPLGVLGLHFVLPISAAIIALLFIIFLSYRQTIEAYPNGGGSYTVAKENLGRFWGLLAAAALLLDYILVVAVGISAGVGALISTVPSLQPFTLSLCLLILIFITLVNLRGMKESGLAFVLPTYLFVFTLLFVLAIGLVKTALSGGHPIPAQVPPLLSSNATEPFNYWLLLRAFASGCTAMTGVEAVSNGVTAFRVPVAKNARRTLSLIIFILIALLAGIAYLAVVYKVGATEPGQAGYESMISQLVRAIVGRGWFYYVTLGSVITVLALSANTGFADFPRLCQILANDNYLPHAFAERGRRLVFNYGIIILALLSGGLLVLFQGVTDNLIPLFAIGAFLAFTLSQAGMVVYWLKLKRKNSTLPLTLNFIGAVATLVTLLIVLVSKFTEGGWITVLVIPVLLTMFAGVRRHYAGVQKEISCREPLGSIDKKPPLVIVPVRGWSKITRKALRFGMEMSDQVFAVHVQSDEKSSLYLKQQWEKYVLTSSESSLPQLIDLPCPYRRLFGSILHFIDELEKKHPGQRIAVVIPNLSELKWYHFFLHNQRAVLLTAALFLRRDPRIVMVTIPWYLES